MNEHVKHIVPEATDLSRRSFLVGTAAAGLVLGYAGVPGTVAGTAPTSTQVLVPMPVAAAIRNRYAVPLTSSVIVAPASPATTSSNAVQVAPPSAEYSMA